MFVFTIMVIKRRILGRALFFIYFNFCKHFACNIWLGVDIWYRSKDEFLTPGFVHVENGY